MTKYTPGPWQAIVPPSSCLTTRHVQGQSGEHVASVGLPGGHSCGTLRDVANANLIAAAPDLLEALRNCVSALETHYVAGEKLSIYYAGRVERARDAIAKAEGTS